MPDIDLVDRSARRLVHTAAVIAANLSETGFDVVAGAAMRHLIESRGGGDWHDFSRSWNDLPPDGFMADGGTYRKRRFACLSAVQGTLQLKPARPHFQTLADNPLNGGVDRTFAPVRDEVALHAVVRAMVATCLEAFEVAVRPHAWHVEMHQFRIEARPDVPGKPTPEGLHRDGVDRVLVMLVSRENVAGGVSTVTDLHRRVLQDVTLSDPLDALWLDDRRVLHGVSPIRPLDPERAAWRDVLVLTFRREDS